MKKFSKIMIQFLSFLLVMTLSLNCALAAEASAAEKTSIFDDVSLEWLFDLFKDEEETEPTVSEDGKTVTLSKSEYDRLMALEAKYNELIQIQEYVDEYYYTDVDDTKLMQGAAAGLLAGLEDPYTFYYTPEAFAEMWEDDEGNYAGVGLLITTSYVTGICTITRVFEGSPSLEAGIRRGDILNKVEDLDVNSTTINDAVNIMRGEVGKPVNIQVIRGDELLDFVVTRAEIHTNWVSSCMLDDEIGYISLYEFAGDCSQAFTTQVNELLQKGAKALVIDLRDNPGGWTEDARAICDLFMGEGIVATLTYRDGSQEVMYTANDDNEIDVPLVLMVNENSASSSEIMAGALQDRGRATLVGTQTYGKGVVQWVLPVGDEGAGFQMTIAQYYTPSGNAVHKVGITPDVIAEMPEEQTGTLFELGDLSDDQLRVAYEEAKTLLKK